MSSQEPQRPSDSQEQMEVEEPEQYSGDSYVEQPEIMELADPSGYLSSVGTPVVFTIPSSSASTRNGEGYQVIEPNNIEEEDNEEGEVDDEEEGEEEEVAEEEELEEEEEEEDGNFINYYDRKSDADIEEESKRLNWLGFPNRVLNKLTTEEELLNYNYKLPERGEKSLPVFQPKQATSKDDSSDSDWETMSESSADSGDENEDPDTEFESTYVYVELDEIPNIQELFAENPDEFLRFQNRQFRHKPQPKKPTHPKLDLKFYQFDTTQPILRIGQKYYTGCWEESIGSSLFFKKKSDKSEALKNIVEEPEIPIDETFAKQNNPKRNNYELVAIADKVLKLQAYEASQKIMHKIPMNNNQPFMSAITGYKVPKGYTVKEILAGKYTPKRGFKKRRNLSKSFGEVIRKGGSLSDIEDGDDEETSKRVRNQDETLTPEAGTSGSETISTTVTPAEDEDDDVMALDPLMVRLEEMRKTGMLYR